MADPWEDAAASRPAAKQVVGTTSVPAGGSDPWELAAKTHQSASSEDKGDDAERDFLDKDIPLSGAWYNPTLSGIQSIGRGLRSAVQGVTALPGQAYDDVTNGRIPIIHELGEGIRSTAKAIPQIPQAIRDINASPDPLSHYAQAAQDTAGQGAGQALLAAGTEGLGRGVVKSAPYVKAAIGKGMSVTGDIVDPDITGIVSPRLAHVQRMLGKAGAAISPKSVPVYPGAPLPETPAPELLQAQKLVQGGRSIPDPAAGLARVPPTAPVTPKSSRIPAWQAAPSEGTEVPSILNRQPIAQVPRAAAPTYPGAPFPRRPIPSVLQAEGKAIPVDTSAEAIKSASAPARDTAILDQVTKAHPEWSLSKRLQEAAKVANPKAIPADTRILGQPPRYSENPKFSYQATGRPIPYFWEEGGRGLPDLEDDKAVQQHLQDQYDRDQRIVWAEAGREKAARNSMDIPKSELIRRARIAKPIPAAPATDLTPEWQKALDDAKARRAAKDAKR